MLRTWRRVFSELWMPERPHGRQVLVAVVSVPPLSSAHEWGQPLRARAMDLQAFGHGTSGDVHREGAGEAERCPRESGEQGVGRETNLPPYVRAKQEDDYATSPLDDYFCKGMAGPASWAKVLQEMARGGS